MRQSCRFALATLLWLPMTLVSAETFELSDPANEMYQEWQEEKKEMEAQSDDRDAVCAVDLDTGVCSCVDAHSEEVMLLSREECLDLVSEAAAAGLE